MFIYACNKNTLHTTGDNVTQNYKVTTANSVQKIESDVNAIYGKHLKGLIVNENEELDDTNFGTLGYFKKRMNNQMQNIRKGYQMAKAYSERHNFEYDVIVRCRPDNAMFLQEIKLDEFPLEDGRVFTTIYPSGHKDPWFFSFSNSKTFDRYCSFVYQKDADETRTDNNFECPEIALERYLNESKMQVYFVQSICLPFYQYDKTQPVTDFPFRQVNEKLIDANGNLVEQK